MLLNSFRMYSEKKTGLIFVSVAEFYFYIFFLNKFIITKYFSFS